MKINFFAKILSYNLEMELKEFFKNELKGFNKKESFIFIGIIFLILFLSFILNDNKIALISAVCGISYTILAGKGKVLCYFIGIIGTFCYCYLAFKNGFFGNLLLYGFYYLPMEIIGIFKWKKHYKKDKSEVKKTKLSKKERIIYFSSAFIFSFIATLILKINNGSNPYADSITTVFSILGQFLTVKRCIEQWYVWFFVNLLSLIMWIYAYIQGSNCFATIFMWGVYLILSVYFLILWKKELKNTLIL
ncbi:MAG: nicotinamide riboside transporter PnuC [bacterium]|nr:nicotinamide riboside transporter PnuC [bacterium]